MKERGGGGGEEAVISKVFPVKHHRVEWSESCWYQSGNRRSRKKNTAPCVQESEDDEESEWIRSELRPHLAVNESAPVNWWRSGDPQLSRWPSEITPPSDGAWMGRLGGCVIKIGRSSLLGFRVGLRYRLTHGGKCWGATCWWGTGSSWDLK